MVNIGERIRFLREKLGLNQAKLAKQLGLGSATVVSRYESNQRQPDIATLVNLAAMAKISLDDLLTGEGPLPDMMVRFSDGSLLAIEGKPIPREGKVNGHLEQRDLDANAPQPDELEIMFNKLDRIYDRISDEDKDRLYGVVGRLCDKYEKAAVETTGGRALEAGDTSEGRFPEGEKKTKKDKDKRKSA